MYPTALREVMKMKLIESIATYTGESRRRMEQILNDDIKAMIAKIARNQEDASIIDSSILKELIEMDVFRYCDGKIKPNTAMFFEEDIEKFYTPIFAMGKDLADIVKHTGDELKNSSPNIRNFIGSIMGMGQGLHAALKNMNLATNWQNKTGKYEKSKVDFNQQCEAYDCFGEDLQIKRIHRGKIYTSVVIGPGNDDYCSYLWNAQKVVTNNGALDFYNNLVTYLTDTIPLLITVNIHDESLKKVAQISNIDISDITSVISVEDAQKYQYVINKISKACTEYIISNMDHIQELLMCTIVGKQGVPTESMMMNFWRYLRRAAAINLYQNGFLNDNVPTAGTITIFYDNNIDYFG